MGELLTPSPAADLVACLAAYADRTEGAQRERSPASHRQQDKGQGKIGRSALPTPTLARESVSHPDLHSSDLQDSVCLMIEAAGRAHGLPPEFFVRVIWQESRFRSDTVGPRRHNGESAQGIAQFMPSTAAEKGLLDPFDPVQALPKAAQFLRELTDQFGSLGLAAAAYNAGPARVRAWLAGERSFPQRRAITSWQSLAFPPMNGPGLVLVSRP